MDPSRSALVLPQVIPYPGVREVMLMIGGAVALGFIIRLLKK